MQTHQIDKKELKATIEQFHRNTEVKQRYASYDFCYVFFKPIGVILLEIWNYPVCICGHILLVGEC